MVNVEAQVSLTPGASKGGFLSSLMPSALLPFVLVCGVLLPSALPGSGQIQYGFTNFVGLPCGASGTNDGIGSAARFNLPYGLCIDSFNNIYVADYFNYTIRKVSAAGEVTTLAGMARQPGTVDDTGSAARFKSPQSVTVDQAGNVYVADSTSHAIRKVTSSGVVTTLAGLGGVSGWADGDGATARFKAPCGVALDRAGNVYVADTYNQTIRVVTPTGTVTSLAGGRSEMAFGTNDGTGTAARFNYPSHVAVDLATNIYVADSGNHCIRKISPAGVVTTLAGCPGYSGSADGVGQAARFYNPRGLAVDSAGSIYVTDNYNHTVRMVSAAGVVTTIGSRANGPSGCRDGIGSAAGFAYPCDVVLGAAGKLYVLHSNSISIASPMPDPATFCLTGQLAFRDNTFQLECFTVPGKTHLLQFREDLSGTNWTTLFGVIGDGTPQKFIDTNAPASQRFYRVMVP